MAQCSGSTKREAKECKDRDENNKWNFRGLDVPTRPECLRYTRARTCTGAQATTKPEWVD